MYFFVKKFYIFLFYKQFGKILLKRHCQKDYIQIFINSILYKIVCIFFDCDFS